MKRARYPGVYAIRCSANKRIYVGSSYDVNHRIFGHGGHRLSLIKGEHTNRHLQADFDRFGLDAFEAALIEEADTVEQARKLENEWLSILFSCPSSEIYNISTSANGGGCRNRDYEIISPSGEVVRGRGVATLCRKHGLYPSMVCKVLKDPKFVYKGWKNIAYQEPEQEVRGFISPDGMLHEVRFKELRAFYVKHGLIATQMCDLWAKRRPFHKGWTRYDRPQFKKVCSPDGRVFAIGPNHILKFGKLHGVTNIRGLARGDTARTSNGWTLVDPSAPDRPLTAWMSPA